jgi:uncharacterized protein (TIGR01777 family)
MTIVLVGATGFIGRALVLRLLGEGHRVIALARDAARARDVLPAGVDVVAQDDRTACAAAIAAADGVVSLAGESIAGGRWTRRRRERLRASRVELTRWLVELIDARPAPLSVLVTASAIGWYGDRGDEPVDEQAPPGRGFLAELCRDWEAAAAAARNARRIVRARFGVVLGEGGGALRPLTAIYRLGLGGRIGSGEQWVSWVHLEDAIAAISRALTDERLAGPVNVVAPGAVRQRELSAALARALHRPAVLPVPRPALSFALGEAARLLTGGARVLPGALEGAGFPFRFPSLDAALADLTGAAAVGAAATGSAAATGIELRRADPAALPDADYVRSRRPRYTLATRTVIDAPLDEVFAFFSAAENLAAITPRDLAFSIASPRPIRIERGTVIDYRVAVAGVPLRWRTLIEVWEPGVRFVDAQVRGPYRAWWHEHRFAADGARTIMDDIVYYALPLGPLGRLGHVVVRSMLRRIFAFRSHAIRARFPPRGGAAAARSA